MMRNVSGKGFTNAQTMLKIPGDIDAICIDHTDVSVFHERIRDE